MLQSQCSKFSYTNGPIYFVFAQTLFMVPFTVAWGAGVKPMVGVGWGGGGGGYKTTDFVLWSLNCKKSASDGAKIFPFKS